MNKKRYTYFMMMFVCMLYISEAKAQTVLTPVNTYVITKKTGTPEAELAAKSVEKTDFNNYRLRSSHRKLTFENGVVIELLSAEELVNLGFKINPMNYREKTAEKYIEPIYSIAPNGILIQMYPNSPSSSKSKTY